MSGYLFEALAALLCKWGHRIGHHSTSDLHYIPCPFGRADEQNIRQDQLLPDSSQQCLE